MANALTAGQQTVTKLPRWQVRVARNVFEPFHSIARRALQFERLERTLCLVTGQASRHISRRGDITHERYCVFHCKLGAGPDAKVRGVRRIADQDDVAVIPALTQYVIEVEPGGTTQVPCIA